MDTTSSSPAHRVPLAAIVSLGLLGAIVLPGPAVGQAGDRGKMLDQPAITAALDIGHAGNFTGLIDTGADTLCYILNAPLDHPTRAVIADPAGKPVVTLATPDARGASAGCVAIPAAAIAGLRRDADDYALVIDTRAYPAEVEAPLHWLPSEA